MSKTVFSTSIFFIFNSAGKDLCLMSENLPLIYLVWLRGVTCEYLYVKLKQINCHYIIIFNFFFSFYTLFFFIGKSKETE